MEPTALEIEESKDVSDPQAKTSGASVHSTAIGIAKNIVGSGIVAMPQVMLLASIIPSLLMTFMMCYLSAYSFYMIGNLCYQNNCNSFQDLWRKSFAGTKFERRDWIVSATLIGMTFGGLVSYCKLFGDFGSYLVNQIPGCPRFIASDSGMILMTHGLLQFLILPESINSLRYFNLIGIAALIYFTCYITVTSSRYLNGGMPEKVREHVGNVTDHLWVFRVAWLAPFSTLSSTFMAHYNAPRFIGEMENKNEFKRATTMGFIGALFPTAVVMMMGFLCLRGFMEKNLDISGNIIKILGHQHAEHNNAYLIVCASLFFANVLLTYPLVFISLRDAMLKCTFTEYNTKIRLIVSEILFLIVLGFSLIPIPVDSVIRWKGAVFAPFILFIFPSMFYFRLVEKAKRNKLESFLAHFFLYFGGIVCISSTVYCFLESFKVKLFP